MHSVVNPLRTRKLSLVLISLVRGGHFKDEIQIYMMPWFSWHDRYDLIRKNDLAVIGYTRLYISCINNKYRALKFNSRMRICQSEKTIEISLQHLRPSIHQKLPVLQNSLVSQKERGLVDQQLCPLLFR